MGKELKVVEHSLCAVSGSSRDDAGFRSHKKTSQRKPFLPVLSAIEAWYSYQNASNYV